MCLYSKKSPDAIQIGASKQWPISVSQPFCFLVFQSSPVLGRAGLEIRIRAIMSGSDTTQFMAEPSQIEHRFTPRPPPFQPGLVEVFTVARLKQTKQLGIYRCHGENGKTGG
jgi:hypothetical protein